MISNLYRQLLIGKLIKEKFVLKGDSSSDEVAAYVDAKLKNLDLSLPQFSAPKFSTFRGEEASAGKFNVTFDTLRQDLDVIYKALSEITETSITSVDRWKLESRALEKRLQLLEDRIENLLLLAQDTEGYNSFIVDNLDNLDYVDVLNTTVQVDTVASQAYMRASNSTLSRIYLENWPLGYIRFKARNGQVQESVSGQGETRQNITNQNDNDWWLAEVTTTKEEPVVCDLIIQLGEAPIYLSSIYLSLHDPVQSGSVSVTPLYSVDDYSYSQLPTTTFTQDIKSTGIFNFTRIRAKYIKFVLAKPGSDDRTKNNEYRYYFGFHGIEFYNESFDTASIQQLITTPFFVTDSDNNPAEFAYLALEACERIESNTDIQYFITASHDDEVPINADTKWFPIASINRYVEGVPSVLDIGDLEEREYGIDEDVTISYDAAAADLTEINPAQNFHLLSDNETDLLLDEAVVATDVRYAFNADSEAILNYQVKDSDYTGSGTGSSVDIDEDSFVLFRNVGIKGLNESESASYVRGIMRGWRFEDPYYISIIEIKNPEGLSIDVGDGFIVIDGVRYSGKVGASVLYGKTEATDGLHEVKVYKDFWRTVTPGANTLDDLKTLDSLYPYNQKLLIEGYDYGTDYSADSEFVYIGVDLFAAYKMKKISIFDLVQNISDTDYPYFALDRDAPNTHTGNNEATRVFVVKIDQNNPDLQYEHFVLRFNQINQRFEYFRLRADFTTESAGITPSLDGWKIRLGG